MLISNEIKQDILVNLIEPNIKSEISTNIKLKKFFKKVGLTFETMSKFFVGVSSVLSFSTGIYNSGVLSFLAGTSSVVSLVMLQYSSYAYRESKKHTSEINNLLTKLNIENIPQDDLSDKSSLEPTTPKNKNSKVIYG